MVLEFQILVSTCYINPDFDYAGVKIVDLLGGDLMWRRCRCFVRVES